MPLLRASLKAWTGPWARYHITYLLGPSRDDGGSASDCKSSWGEDYCKCAQAAQTEATDAKTKDGITVATIYVQPPPGVDSCGSNCYPAADYLRDKIASPGQASEYDWDNIAQSVGGLADQILAKLC